MFRPGTADATLVGVSKAELQPPDSLWIALSITAGGIDGGGGTGRALRSTAGGGCQGAELALENQEISPFWL
jgi:hypothetical protein